MAHGQPDFGMYTEKKTTYGLADMGELAARLGSIVTFDRRGDVIWLDDFESDVFKWDITFSGLGWEVVQTPTYARNGAFSVKLTTGRTVDQYVRIQHYNAYPVKSNIGLELSMSKDSWPGEFIIFFDLYDGVTHYIAGIRYDITNDDLYRYVDPLTWTLIDSAFRLYEDADCFNTLKLVVDFVDELYTRFIANNAVYDLSTYPIYSVASPIRAHLEIRIDVISDLAANRSAYVDDVILTQNEP